jgi:hypothetical protein
MLYMLRGSGILDVTDVSDESEVSYVMRLRSTDVADIADVSDVSGVVRHMLFRGDTFDTLDSDAPARSKRPLMKSILPGW